MTFIDSYEWISGWIHDYYCDRDGSLLVFDLHNSQYFECPVCHFKYTDIKRKRAWIIKYRYKIFQLLEDYSKKYLEFKDEEFLHFIEDALSYYSFNYEKFVLHNKEGKIFDILPKTSNRCGRITAQGLNEAMLCIQIVHCIDNLYSYLNANLRESVFHLLFPQIYVLLKSQIHKIHNISCYEICSIAMMGILSSNKEMLEFAFSSRYSFYNQLDQGVTKDFLWFEGSFHYHFFVLKPILQLLRLAKKYQFYIPNKYYELVKKMLLKGYKMSFSDCSLPSPNDGWPNRYLSDYIEVFELGNQIFIDDFSVILKSIYARSNCYATTHCLDTGFSILKNKYWNVFIKYYENNISHAHPDKLNIEVKFGNNFLTHDLSTSGYGSTISSAFYKRTYSHNTIVIDGKDSNLSCNSIIHSYNENMIDVMVEDIYANINISRKIELLGKKMNDWIHVFYCGDKSVDYLFHCDAELISRFDIIKKDSFLEYPYFKNILEIIYPFDEIFLEWKLGEKRIVSRIDLKSKKLFICSSPDNPNIKERTTLLIRSQNIKNPLFHIVWEII